MKTRIGMVTIGQAPRVDVVPEMADLIGPRAEIVERGALDGLDGSAIAALAPRPRDEVLVTRLADGSSVFLGKERVTPLVQARIDAVERDGAALTVVLCTGTFAGLRATRPLVEPDRVLHGVLRGVAFRGRLGILTPSERHIEQTRARWTAYGFDPVVLALSPYHGDVSDHDVAGITHTLREAGVGFVLGDCMGFRRSVREGLAAALGVPVVIANLLVARVVAELIGD
ncbi:MAG TPA: AroM family protein [Methylomirabilota bacterium]